MIVEHSRRLDTRQTPPPPRELGDPTQGFTAPVAEEIANVTNTININGTPKVRNRNGTDSALNGIYDALQSQEEASDVEGARNGLHQWETDGGARKKGVIPPEEQAIIDQGNATRQRATDDINRNPKRNGGNRTRNRTDENIHPYGPLGMRDTHIPEEDTPENNKPVKTDPRKQAMAQEKKEKEARRKLASEVIIKNSGGTALVAYAMLQAGDKHNPRLFKEMTAQIDGNPEQAAKAIYDTFVTDETKKLHDAAQKAAKAAELAKKSKQKLENREKKLSRGIEDTVALYRRKNELQIHAKQLLSQQGLNVTGRIGAWVDKKRIDFLDKRITVANEREKIVAKVQDARAATEKKEIELQEIKENDETLAQKLRSGPAGVSDYIRQHIESMPEDQLCKVLGISPLELYNLSMIESKENAGAYDKAAAEKARNKILGKVREPAVAVNLAEAITRNELDDRYNTIQVMKQMPEHLRIVRDGALTPYERRLQKAAQVASFGGFALLGILSMVLRSRNKES